MEQRLLTVNLKECFTNLQWTVQIWKCNIYQNCAAAKALKFNKAEKL